MPDHFSDSSNNPRYRCKFHKDGHINPECKMCVRDYEKDAYMDKFKNKLKDSILSNIGKNIQLK